MKQNRGLVKKWNERFIQFEKSGLGVKQFCREYNTTPSRFYYWKKRLSYKNISKIKENRSHDFFKISKDKNTKIIISGHEIIFSDLPDPIWIAKFARELKNESTSI